MDFLLNPPNPLTPYDPVFSLYTAEYQAREIATNLLESSSLPATQAFNTSSSPNSDHSDSVQPSVTSTTQESSMDRSSVSELIMDNSSSQHLVVLDTTSTNTTGKPLKTFTCFEKLPPEIRCMIWKLIEFRYPRTYNIGNGGDIFGGIWKPEEKLLYHINLESRREMFKLNPLLQFANYRPDNKLCRFVPFRPEIDIMHFLEGNGIKLINKLCRVEQNRKEFEKVRRIVLEYDVKLTASRQKSIPRMEKAYSALPKLIEIQLTMGCPNPDGHAYAHRGLKEISKDDFEALNRREKKFVGMYEEVVDVLWRRGGWKGEGRPYILVCKCEGYERRF